MKAYRVGHHDNGYDSHENVLVYHYTEEAAQELGRNCLSNGNSWDETCAARAPEHDARCVNQTEPYQEEDPEYLREQGWTYEDETKCLGCSLAAFGREEFAVCNECGMCKECGCDQGCDESEEPCKQSEGWSCEGMKTPSPVLEPPSSAVSPPSQPTEDSA